jgi:hypothetical protein
MKLADRLNKEQAAKLNRMRKKKMRKSEVLDLMGVNRDTYRRVRGKIKNNRK